MPSPSPRADLGALAGIPGIADRVGYYAPFVASADLVGWMDGVIRDEVESGRLSDADRDLVATERPDLAPMLADSRSEVTPEDDLPLNVTDQHAEALRRAADLRAAGYEGRMDALGTPLDATVPMPGLSFDPRSTWWESALEASGADLSATDAEALRALPGHEFTGRIHELLRGADASAEAGSWDAVVAQADSDDDSDGA